MRLPLTKTDAAALLRKQQKRFSPKDTRVLGASALKQWLVKGALQEWRIGWHPIVAWLRKELDDNGRAGRQWLLWGTYHDAGGQIDAFRRLLGPGGVGHWDLLALEGLAADGYWRGVPLATQRGDDVALRRFARTGTAVDREVLQQRQERYHYTAWKYGYVSSMMSIIDAAQARGIPLVGCDMNGALQRRLASLPTRPSLRELHCAMALERALHKRRASKVGILWGMAHAKPSGFWRWLPAADTVVAVYVLGHRQSAFSPEGILGKHLILFDPLLVPLASRLGREALLFLPDRLMGGRWSRARTTLRKPLAQSHLAIDVPGPGVFRVRMSQSHGVVSASANRPSTLLVKVKAGCHLFDWRGRYRMIGRVCVPLQGKTVLTLLPKQREARKVLWEPKAP